MENEANGVREPADREVGPRAPTVIGNVVSGVAERILTGQLRPGDTLANETGMMAEFGVSRTTLREAVKILSGKGFLETRRRHGTRVLARERWNILDGDVLAWMMRSASPEVFMRELLEMRRIFEPEAAALAAERATRSDIAALERACGTMEKTDIETEDFVRADAAFHETLLVAAHNQFLMGLGNSIRASLTMFLRYTTEDPSVFERGRPHHRAVLERIVARDAAGARATMHGLLDGAQQLVDRITTGTSKASRTRRRPKGGT